MDPVRGRGARRAGWLNVPNAISVARLLILVPLVIILMLSAETRVAATIALVVFGLTDWVDGFWARRFGQTTRVGEILDPVADRLGIAIICGAMTWLQILPVWMLVVIVVVDLGLGIVGGTRLHAIATTRVTWLGKVRTALLMTGLPLLLLATDTRLDSAVLYQTALVILGIGCVLHCAAGLYYAVVLIRAPKAAMHPNPAHHE